MNLRYTTYKCERINPFHIRISSIDIAKVLFVTIYIGKNNFRIILLKFFVMCKMMFIFVRSSTKFPNYSLVMSVCLYEYDKADLN